MDLPFDAAISTYFENDAPEAIRNAIRRADKDEIITDSYPHPERLARKVYEREMEKLASASPVFLRGAMPRAKAAQSAASARI
jgi:hypothetical protein